MPLFHRINRERLVFQEVQNHEFPCTFLPSQEQFGHRKTARHPGMG
jgi:hypothetical protein